MDKLTEAQKSQLLSYLKKYEYDSWDHHASWATTQFGVVITPKEVSDFYMALLFNL